MKDTFKFILLVLFGGSFISAISVFYYDIATSDLELQYKFLTLSIATAVISGAIIKMWYNYEDNETD